MCKLEDFRNLELSPYYRDVLKRELETWHICYLPVRGTVLDAGAGCGETVQFFLNHGAEHVIAIEFDSEPLSYLRKNFGMDPRVTIIEARLGKLKIDIEGSEEDMIIETHFPPVFTQVSKMSENYALWKIGRTKAPVYSPLYWRVRRLVHIWRVRVFKTIRGRTNRLQK